jgi:hypothetical protein
LIRVLWPEFSPRSTLKRKHDFLIEDERALVLPPLAAFRQLAPTSADARHLAQNRLTAAPLDLLALLARHLDTGALQQLCRFLFDAFAIHQKMCFTRYQAAQCALLRLLLCELHHRPPLLADCVRAQASRILLANEPRNFPARIQPERAARHTECVVRANQYQALFVFVNCTLLE